MKEFYSVSVGLIPGLIFLKIPKDALECVLICVFARVCIRVCVYPLLWQFHIHLFIKMFPPGLARP